MRNKLPKANELRHITAQELCDRMDDYFEEINKQDTALIIDTDHHSYVLCPARWFDLEIPENGHFNIAMSCALRYALDRPTGIADTMTMIIRESLPRLNEQTLRGMIRDIDEQFELKPDNCNRSTLEQLKADITSYLTGNDVGAFGDG